MPMLLIRKIKPPTGTVSKALRSADAGEFIGCVPDLFAGCVAKIARTSASGSMTASRLTAPSGHETLT